ncbi:MAG: DUF1822 family protein [Synechococcales cyanobacterium RU_4_20]|nr:DUF1822 family protein [Synechococcales cyanobacterium RU_4_20]NJR67636.1 DUF1822 family protein [Synechococcales cyanobacterium CRU_2_2]
MAVLSEVVADARHWWIPLDPEVVQRSWQHSQRHSQPGRCWDDYLGRLCLVGLAEGLAELEALGLSKIQPGLSPSLSVWTAVWEGVGGCVLRVMPEMVIAEGVTAEGVTAERVTGNDRTTDEIRLVVIPGDEIDAEALVVPQEWVDVPDWRGHYYLAVQLCGEAEAAEVGDEECEPYGLRVWGYASHRQLKERGDYDPQTRNYVLSRPDLQEDLTALSVTLRHCDTQGTQAVVEPLAVVSAVQRENLLERLGDPALAFPRLAVPFALWGALIQDEDWRKRLYQRRCQGWVGQVDAQVTRLSQWLEGQFEQGWRSLTDLLGPGTAFAPQLRSGMVDSREIGQSDLTSGFPLKRAKSIILGGISGEMTDESADDVSRVILLVSVVPTSIQSDSVLQVQVQLHPLCGQQLPPRVRLVLHDPEQVMDLQAIESGAADTYLQLTPLTGRVGETFQVRIEYPVSSQTHPSQEQDAAAPWTVTELFRL